MNRHTKKKKTNHNITLYIGNIIDLFSLGKIIIT